MLTRILRHLSFLTISALTFGVVIAQNGTELTPITVDTATDTVSIEEFNREAFTALTWAPNGNVLAVSDASNIWLYDMSDFNHIDYDSQPLESDSYRISDLAWNPDGTLLASANASNTGYSITVWDIDSGEIALVLEGHTLPIWSIEFSPDGKTLASGGDDGIVRLWDVTSGEMLHTLEDDYALQVSDITFNPNGTELAVAGHQGSLDRVWIWNLKTGDLVRRILGPSFLNNIAYNPDGTILAGEGISETVGNSIWLWDGQTGDELTVFLSYPSPIRSIAFNVDGTILAVGFADSTVQLLDASTGQVLTTLEGHSEMIQKVAFNANETMLASASIDGKIFLWGILPK
jgi:WD40 repeat protein